MDTMDLDIDTSGDYEESNFLASPEDSPGEEQSESSLQIKYYRAVKCGNVQAARAILQQGIEVDEGNPDGGSALHTAFLCPNPVDMVRLLFEHGADPDLYDEYSRNTLLHAIQNDVDLRVIKLLLDNEVDVNSTDWEKRNALHYATSYKHGADKLVQLLLDYECDPYRTDIHGKLPIHDAVLQLADESQVVTTKKAIEVFIKYDLWHNNVDNYGKSALYYAVQFGTNGLVQPPPRRKPRTRRDGDYGIVDKFGRTALHYTAIFGWGAKDLMDRDVNQNAEDKDGETAIRYAVSFSNSLALRDLLRGSARGQLNNADAHGRTLLHYAALEGSAPDILRQLFKAGSTVNAVDAEGKTPLHYAAVTGVLVDDLLDAFADVNAVDKMGRTALHEAARHRTDQSYRVLMLLNPDLNHRDDNGRTALHEASSAGAIEIVLDLLSHGAEVRIPDQNQRTALHDAAAADSQRIVLALLDKGADVKAISLEGETALHEAARAGSLESVSMLLANGADLETKNNRGQTALHLAAEAGSHQTIDVLLQKGADITSRDSEGKTALHYAAGQPSYLPVKLLLDRGADIRTRDNKNATVFHYAVIFGSSLTARQLLRRGAGQEGLLEAAQNILPILPSQISINPFDTKAVKEELLPLMYGEYEHDVPSISAFEWNVPYALYRYRRPGQEASGRLLRDAVMDEDIQILEDMPVVAGSDGVYEFTSCRRYLQEHYGSAGMGALELVKEAILNWEQPIVQTTISCTLILQAFKQNLIVCKLRPAGRDAEEDTLESVEVEDDMVDEAIMWICQAVRHPPGDARVWVSHDHQKLILTEFLRIYSLGALVECDESTLGESACWTKLFTQVVIADCFLHRPWGKGLKIPFNSVIQRASLRIRRPLLDLEDGRRGEALLGYYTALIPVAVKKSRKQPAIQWHLVQNEEEDMQMSGAYLAEIGLELPWVSIDIGSAGKSECYVGSYES